MLAAIIILLCQHVGVVTAQPIVVNTIAAVATVESIHIEHKTMNRRP